MLSVFFYRWFLCLVFVFIQVGRGVCFPHYGFLCLYVYMFICLYVYMFICLYVYMFIRLYVLSVPVPVPVPVPVARKPYYEGWSLLQRRIPTAREDPYYKGGSLLQGRIPTRRGDPYYKGDPDYKGNNLNPDVHFQGSQIPLARIWELRSRIWISGRAHCAKKWFFESFWENLVSCTRLRAPKWAEIHHI